MGLKSFLVTIYRLPSDMFKRVWLLLSILVFIWGCAPISQALVRQSEPDVRFRALKENPGLYQGKTVILGGEVVSVTLKDGNSVLLVAQKALDSRQRPVDDAREDGFFQVVSLCWLDPDAYIPRRKVTVAGVVLGDRKGLLTLQAQEIYLWEDPRQLDDFLREWFEPELHDWFTRPYFDPWKASW